MHIMTKQMSNDNRQEFTMLVARMALSGLLIAQYLLAMLNCHEAIE